jgi:hypothetical protein
MGRSGSAMEDHRWYRQRLGSPVLVHPVCSDLRSPGWRGRLHNYPACWPACPAAGSTRLNHAQAYRKCRRDRVGLSACLRG